MDDVWSGKELGSLRFSWYIDWSLPAPFARFVWVLLPVSGLDMRPFRRLRMLGRGLLVLGGCAWMASLLNVALGIHFCFWMSCRECFSLFHRLWRMHRLDLLEWVSVGMFRFRNTYMMGLWRILRSRHLDIDLWRASCVWLYLCGHLWRLCCSLAIECGFWACRLGKLWSLPQLQRRHPPGVQNWI